MMSGVHDCGVIVDVERRSNSSTTVVSNQTRISMTHYPSESMIQMEWPRPDDSPNQ